MKRTILFLSLALGAGLMVTNLYNSMIDARSWGSDLPNSLETARQYFRAANPGDFFRIFSPLNQVLALLAVIFFWRSARPVRTLLLLALAFHVAADIFTFAYFYPRNDIMFLESPLDLEKARAAWEGWSSMNWLRTLIVGAGVVSTSLALDRLYSLRVRTESTSGTAVRSAAATTAV
jgi:hypothetical protein